MSDTTKHPVESRTLWANGLALAALLLTYVIESRGVLPPGTLPEAFYQWAAYALGLVNVVLRFVTTKGLSFRG